jgi:L-threonylcarbamoyladenylate synthase
MDVRRAAEILRAGGLVAFPTETVYGLGANAFDANAVAHIYRAKGRPATSPLIVHVSSIGMARSIVLDWPDAADRLAAGFWPGPLTMVLRKQQSIPDIVTAGLPTVGVRMPSHPVALALIEAAGVPIAAPSANRFTELSPVTAEHVRRSLGDSVDYVLEGGATQVGIESAVISLVDAPVLLRPGTISVEQISEVLGSEVTRAGAFQPGPHPSPGMHERHYSPRTPLYLSTAPRQGRGVVLRLSGSGPVQMPRTPEEYARDLYATLHRLDAEGYDWIAVEMPPDTPQWQGVRDRLTRASVKE